MSPTSLLPSDQPVAWVAIRACGEDAVAFLQGQLTLDVVSLSAGESQPGLLLSPSGEVISSLTCRRSDEGVEMVVRAEVVNAVTNALRRFLLRTRCRFEVVEGARGPYGTVGQQVDRFTPGPAEFARGLPAHSFGPQFVASHVSFTKGCFTGQELVGRLDARGGNVPYRLVRLAGPDLAALDAVVRSRGPEGDRALQAVTTAVSSNEVRALAIVHRTLLEGELVVSAGIRIETVPGAETARH